MNSEFFIINSPAYPQVYPDEMGIYIFHSLCSLQNDFELIVGLPTNQKLITLKRI